MKKTMHRLTNAQMYKLANWLTGQKDWLAEKRPTQYQAATAATEALGFHVAQSNIRAACVMTETRWVGKGTRPEGGGNGKAAIGVLAKAVKEIADSLGLVLSDKRVAELASAQP